MFWRNWDWGEWGILIVITINIINVWYSRKRVKIAETEHEWKQEKYQKKQGKK